MTGADYVALVRLTDLPGNVLAMPGERCDKVPESSLPWLLKNTPPLIQLAPQAKPTTKARSK